MLFASQPLVLLGLLLGGHRVAVVVSLANKLVAGDRNSFEPAVGSFVLLLGCAVGVRFCLIAQLLSS